MTPTRSRWKSPPMRGGVGSGRGRSYARRMAFATRSRRMPRLPLTSTSAPSSEPQTPSRRLSGSTRDGTCATDCRERVQRVAVSASSTPPIGIAEKANVSALEPGESTEQAPHGQTQSCRRDRACRQGRAPSVGASTRAREGARLPRAYCPGSRCTSHRPGRDRDRVARTSARPRGGRNVAKPSSTSFAARPSARPVAVTASAARLRMGFTGHRKRGHAFGRRTTSSRCDPSNAPIA